MKKRLWSVILCLIMVVTFSACGSKTEGNHSNGKDVITIKVFSNLPDRSSGQGMIEQMLFEQYMEENKNIKIEVEALDDESYKTKFKAYASGSSMPDLVNIWGQPSFLNEVIDAGLLSELNLDDYKEYGFLEGALEGFSKDGKLYGLARNTDLVGFYYNKQIFAECGVDIPATYNELLETITVLKEKGYIPIAFDGADKYPMSILMNDFYQKIKGGNCHEEVLKAVESGDYSDPAWDQAVSLVKELVSRGAFQSGFETTDYGTSLNLFSNGQAAMYYMGSWEMSIATNENIDKDIRKSIGAFTMPAVEGGKGLTTDIVAWNGGGYAVTENSKVKEETVKLLNYMFEPQNWSKLCWENGVCMSAQNFSEYLTGNETELQKEWVNILNHSTGITGVTFNDLGTNEFKTVSEDASIELAIGSITTEEFFEILSKVMK